MKRLDALLCLSIIACVPAARAATFTIVNDDTKNDALRQAIADANLTPEPDTIVLPAPAAGEPPVRFDFGGAPESDDLAGSVVLTAVTSDITIEGAGADRVILSASGIDATLLVVRTDPTLALNGGLELPAKLTLRNLTLDRGRGAAAGAVVVRATPPPTGEHPRLIANGVIFVDNHGAQAGAIFNEGAPLDIDDCVFVDGHSDAGAGAIASTTGASIATSTFEDNTGSTGAIIVSEVLYSNDAAEEVPTLLSINASTFANNVGQEVGAVRSRADSGIGNTQFIGNRSESDAALAGAVYARDLAVSGGVFDGNVSRTHGGAIALFTEATGVVQAAIAFSEFTDNFARGNGGAIHGVGVPVTLSDTVLSRNFAADGGGALSLSGGSIDAQRTRFTYNRTRPTVTFLGIDVELDERGDDVATGRVVLSGGGAALRLDGSATYDVSESCFVHNAATAVLVLAGSTGSIDGNYWGTAGDPASTDTVLLPSGTAAPVQAAAPPDICDPVPDGTSERVELSASVRADAVARVGEDFEGYRPGTTVSLFATNPSVLLVPERSGVLDIELRGVNDDEQEGAEAFILQILGCEGGFGACPTYTTSGTPEVGFAIADNGNGELPAEGEGEGECADELALSARALVFEDHGSEPSTQDLVVTNAGSCALTLIAPLVRKGASSGYAVAPVPQSDLALEPGDAVTLKVSYTRPEASDEEVPEGVTEGEEEEAAGPTGLLVVESQGGARFEVPLSLAGGCGCQSTTGAPPWVALALMFLSGRVLSARSRVLSARSRVLSARSRVLSARSRARDPRQAR
jgi:hypothetical protein